MHHLNSKRRAIRNEQKEARRQEILEIAWRMLQTATYETLTMIDVANELGLAKGTLFLYFKTKEALFLALVEQQLVIWFDDIDTQLAGLILACTIPQVTEVLCKTLEARPALIRLLAMLHTVLEYNIDFETALHFKHILREHFACTGPLLEQCLPFMAPGQGAQLLLQCQAMVIGFWHLSDPSPVVKQVLQATEFRQFEVLFAAEFTSALQALLYGLEHIAQEVKADSQKEEIS